MATHDLTLLQMLPEGDVAGALTPERLLHTLLAMQTSAAPLRQICRHERVHAIARTCRALLEPNSERMQRLVTECALESGWSEAMVRQTTTDFLRLCDEPGLTTLLADELGPGVHERTFVPSAQRATQRALVPPPAVLHILASTVPTAPIEAIALTLAAGVPCVIRTSREGRVAARFFLQTLRDHAPELAAHAAVVTWDPSNEGFLRTLDEIRPHIVVHGSDETLQKIRRGLHEPVEVSGFGHRFSFGFIAPDLALTKGQLRDLSERVALDASLFEGGGCMSPQSIFVIPPPAQPTLAEDLAEALATYAFPKVAKTLPRGMPPVEIAAEQMQQAGVAAFRGRAFTSEHGNALLWNDLALRSSPGWRHLHVERIRSLEDLLELLTPWAHNLSTAGVYTGAPTTGELGMRLAAAGVRRICPVGRMQRPVLLRAHDGLPRVRSFFRCCDIEG